MTQIPPIDNSLLMQGDIANPPFMVQCHADPMVAAFATGAIFETLKAMANSSMGMQALFWACQQGNFVQSQPFNQMVSLLADTVDMELGRNQQTNPWNLMQNFAKSVIEWKAATLVANDQRFASSMRDYNVANRIQGLLGQQGQHIQELERFLQWKNQQQNQYRGGHDPRGGGGYSHQGGGYPTNGGGRGGYSYDGGFGGSRPTTGGREVSTGMMGAGMREPTRYDNNWSNRSPQGNGSASSFTDFRKDTTYGEPAVTTEPYKAPYTPEPVREVATTSVDNGVFISHKDLVNRKLISNSAGKNSGVVISLSENRFVYSKLEDGTYSCNVIDNKARNMQGYEHHETRHLFQARSKKVDGTVHTDAELVRKTFSEACNFKTVDELLAILGGDNTLETDITKTPITVDLSGAILQTEIGATMPQVIRELRRNYPDLHSKLNRDNSVLINIQYVDPEVVIGEPAVDYQSFVSSKDFSVAVDRFTRLYDVIPNRIWKWLHDEITHAVNELVYLRFDSGTRIESFVDDHHDLVESLNKKTHLGPEIAKAYVESFQSIIKRFDNSILQAEDVETIIEPIAEDDKDKIVEIIGYRDLMLYVPIDSTAFDFGSERRFGLVTEDFTPELFEVCSRMLDSATNRTRRVRIVTKDAEELLVLRSFFNPANIMIANVQSLTARK